MYLSHFAIAAFTCASIFYHQSYYIRVSNEPTVRNLHLGRFGG